MADSTDSRAWARTRFRSGRRAIRAFAYWACGAVVSGSLAACGGNDNVEQEPVADPGQPGTTVAFQLLPKRMSLNVGGQAAALVFGNEGAVTWTSSDAAVASVDGEGIVTATGRGVATISASAGGQTTSTPLRVYDPAGTPADATSESLIATALAAGRIDSEQALVYRVLARFGDARLPAQYEGAASGDTPVVTMREVQRRLPVLSPSAQETLAPFLVPPIYRESWLGVQLGVAPTAASRSRSVAQSLATTANATRAGPSIACAAGFGEDIIYRKSTAHFNIATVRSGSREAITAVDRLAGMVEAIYAAETSLLQRFPKSDIAQLCNGTDGAIDIYVSPLGADPVTLAETQPYGGCNDVPAFIVVNQLLTDLHYGFSQAPDQLARSDKVYRNVLAHEFMHVIQFGMNRSAACADYDWIDEATAQWAMDHVFPADNQEDGSIRWADDRIRGGGFYVNYLLNEHRTSIEKTLGAANGYSDYVFFQFVARTYGGAAIRALFDAMISNDSVEAIDEGLKAQGGMKEVWPKFARALWMDPDNDALPSVLKADGYDVGLKDVFAGVARNHAIGGGNLHQPVVIGLGAQGRVRKTLLKDAGQFGGGTLIEPRSFHYEYLKFDDAVSGVVLVNPIGNAAAGIRVELLKKIGGRWSAPEDITDKASVSFCRDRRDQRMDELLVIVSHGGGRRNAAPAVLAEDQPMFVAASNVGCWKWQGESTERIISDDGFGNTGDYTARATGIVFEVQTSSLFAGMATFAATAGTASGMSRAKSTLPCDISITGPAQAIGASDGFMWIGLDLDLAPVAAPTRTVSVLTGLTQILSTSDSICVGQHVTSNFLNAWGWLAYPVVSRPVAVSDDGKTMEGDFTETQEGVRAVHTFRFMAMRE